MHRLICGMWLNRVGLGIMALLVAVSVQGGRAQGTTPATYTDIVTNNWITPTKDQGNLGTCWAFGSTTAFQSSLLRQGLVTSTTASNLQLSLWHLATKNGATNPSYVPTQDPQTPGEWEYTGWGGDNNATLSYLTRGVGSWTNVAESGSNGISGGFVLVASNTANAYPQAAAQAHENLTPYVPPTTQPLAPYRLGQSIEHRFTGSGAPGSDPAYRERIKESIMHYGALAGSYFAESGTAAEPFYNPATATFQYSGTATSANHIVAFAGWDDDKVVTNAAGNVTGTGAWLVQNSWGTSYGDGGYFWLGYGDTVALKDAATYIAGSNELSPGRFLADVRLQNGIYAPEEGVAFGYGAGTPTWAATRLSSTEPMSLAGLGLWAATDGCTFSWSVRDALATGTAGILASGTATAAFEGYFELLFGTDLQLSGTSDLYVVLDYGSTYATPVGIDTRSLTLGDVGALTGVSWVSADGLTWNDTTQLESAGLVFAKGLIAVPEPSTLALLGAGVGLAALAGWRPVRRRAGPFGAAAIRLSWRSEPLRRTLECLCVLLPVCGVMADDAALARQGAVEVTTSDNLTQYRNRRDFIAFMGQPIPADSPRTKEAVLAALDRLTSRSRKDANHELVAAWNLLDQTDALSAAEKAAWVEQRLGDLPAPFAMLAGVFKSEQDPSGGMELFYAARMQLVIDGSKCADDTAGPASGPVIQELVSRLHLGIDRSKATDEELEAAFLALRTGVQAKALARHGEIGRNIPKPWWIAHAGMQELVEETTAGKAPHASALFKPESEWPAIEQAVMEQFRKQLAEPPR